jgi:hypothetical protein
MIPKKRFHRISNIASHRIQETQKRGGQWFSSAYSIREALEKGPNALELRERIFCTLLSLIFKPRRKDIRESLSRVVIITQERLLIQM